MTTAAPANVLLLGMFFHASLDAGVAFWQGHDAALNDTAEDPRKLFKVGRRDRWPGSSFARWSGSERLDRLSNH